MRRIFAFQVLVECCGSTNNLGRDAYPGRLLSPAFETDCISDEHWRNARRFGTGEAQYLEPSAERLSKASAEAKERLRCIQPGYSRAGTSGAVGGSIP